MLSKKKEKRILIFTEYKNVIKTIDEFHKFTRKKARIVM
jgi:ERCC4-related helicase